MMKHRSRAAIVDLALGAGLALAAPAHADGAEYRSWLQNHGMSDPAPNGMGLMSLGTQECSALRGGKPERFLVIDLEKEMGIAQSQGIVYAAHQYLCPDA